MVPIEGTYIVFIVNAKSDQIVEFLLLEMCWCLNFTTDLYLRVILKCYAIHSSLFVAQKWWRVSEVSSI